MRKTMRTLFDLDGLISAALGFLVALFTNALSNLLPAGQVVVWLAGLIVAVLLVLGVRRLRPRSQWDIVFQPPLTLRTDAEKAAHARQGLIGSVSMFSPMHDSAARGLAPEEIRAAADRLNYTQLDLLNSNLEPLIQAILAHRTRLRHIWLLGTTAADPTMPGSSVFIPVLIEYLRREHNLTCDFHYGYDYEIPLDDDALVYHKCFDLIQRIFAEAEGLGIVAQEMVTDFTSGIRSIALGAVLASIDGTRNVQMMGTHYQANGRPMPHDLFPMIYSFEPRLPGPKA